jgi:5-methylcytosine-specific restriction endonuclease McrA
VLSKESEAVRRIREVAAQYQTHLLSELPESGRESIDSQMSKVLTINVLEAFHVSKPAAMKPLYEWQRGWSYINLSPESHRFLRDHGSALELVANFYWAEFLEGCNRLAPRIVQKVSRDGATRRSLTGYFKILLAETPAECFYCGSAFGEKAQPAVDHVIPWSFLLEDDLWDLVLACVTCNSRKSDWLPEHKYLDRLIQRNKEVFRNRGLPVNDDDIKRLYQAAVSVEWPRFWTL